MTFQTWEKAKSQVTIYKLALKITIFPFLVPDFFHLLGSMRIVREHLVTRDQIHLIWVFMALNRKKSLKINQL